MAVTFPYSVLNFQNYWAAERDVIDWRFHEIWVSSEFRTSSLQWRHNESDGVPNDRRRDCLLNRLFRRRSKKTSKLHVTGLCGGNPPVIGGFPSHRASTTKNVSIRWRHHVSSYLSFRHFNKACHWRSPRADQASSGIILGMGSANERRRYYVTHSLISRAHAQDASATLYFVQRIKGGYLHDVPIQPARSGSLQVSRITMRQLQGLGLNIYVTPKTVLITFIPLYIS